MEKIQIVAFTVLISFVTTSSSGCPPLQSPEGMVIQCMDQNNGTVDCMNATTVAKGTIGQYRCTNASETDWANSTIKCICRGKWKGLSGFNDFANNSCGALPMTLPVTPSNDTDSSENESSTQSTSDGSSQNQNNDTMASTPMTLTSDNSTGVTDLSSNSTNNLSQENGTSLNNTDSTTTPQPNNPSLNSLSTTTVSISSSSATSDNSGTSLATTVSDISVTTTPASTSSSDNSSSSTTLAAASDQNNTSGSTIIASSSPDTYSSNSSESTATTTTPGPIVGQEGPGQVPDSNTTTIFDNSTSNREGKDLKIPTNDNATSESPLSPISPSGSFASDQSNNATTPIPTVGASLTITNSQAQNLTKDDSSLTTTTSSSISSSSSSSEISSTAAPESLENANGSNSDFQTHALSLHNKIRKNHGSQPLQLNQTMNDLAQSWANNLLNASKLETTPGKRNYAENLFKISGGDKIENNFAVESAIKAWVSSESWYNYTNPKPTGFSQIVWNATTQLGVGLASDNGTSVIVVTTYFPRGNVISVGNKADPTFYFKKNVFPLIDNPEQVFSTSNNGTSS